MIVQNLQERIKRTIAQIEFEGEDTPCIQQIKFVANCWFSILDLLCVKESRDLLLFKVLQLFDSGEISLDFCFSIMIYVMNK